MTLRDEINQALDRGFTLLGVLVNPLTGEIGIVSSNGMEPGAVIGMLQSAVTEFTSAAINGDLEILNDGSDQAGTGASKEVVDIAQYAAGKSGGGGLVH